LHWAAWEASDRGGRLTVCHAWVPEELDLLTEPPLLELARRHGAEIVQQGLQFVEPIQGRDGPEALLADGSPGQVLCERSGAVDMVVAGSRGHGRLAGLLLGSVAWKLAGHGQGRSVIIGGRGRPADDNPGPVVAGVDGSAASPAVLAFAAEGAALRQVPLLAVCAVTDAAAPMGRAHEMEAELTSLLADCEKEHLEVTMLRQVTGSPPRTALLEAGTEAQMLIVGARGRGGMPGMKVGSVTSALLHHAPCPVGIIHPSA
jgi:nucleotide-binding universal stress UspA family protein